MPEIEEAFHHVPADRLDDQPYRPIYGSGEISNSTDDSFHSALESPPISPGDVFVSTGRRSTESPGRLLTSLRSELLMVFASALLYSSEEDLTPPPGANRHVLGGLEAGACQRRQICLRQSSRGEDIHGERASIHHDSIGRTNQTCNGHSECYWHVIRSAEKKGIKVNVSKTNMILCISATTLEQSPIQVLTEFSIA